MLFTGPTAARRATQHQVLPFSVTISLSRLVSGIFVCDTYADGQTTRTITIAGGPANKRLEQQAREQ